MRRFGNFLFALIFGFIIYLLIVRSFALPEIIAGIVISLAVALFTFFVFPLQIKFINPVRWFWFIIYIPIFLKEMIIANIRVAAIVLNPRLPVKPEIKKAKTLLKTPEGILMLTGSITLTPGTLTVEAEGDEITIHCVDTNLTARQIMEPFEKYIRRITE